MQTVACLSGSLMTAERSDSASSFLISLAAGSELAVAFKQLRSRAITSPDIKRPKRSQPQKQSCPALYGSGRVDLACLQKHVL